MNASLLVPTSRHATLRAALVVLILSLGALPFLPSCGSTCDVVPAGDGSVPLEPGSPWPKFRANARQNGRANVTPSTQGGLLWTFPTGKGIFSTPVVAADGTLYVGSADRTFYALNPDGTLRWSVPTGEIIDSSALLDDKGRVYFGSGDGNLYARDAATGQEVWTFAADDPSVSSALINWFEGNVAIGPDGTLYVPNDNFFVYALDRDTAQVKWKMRFYDQTWSLPAVNPVTGNVYIGNNNMLEALGPNTFAYSPTGERLWDARSNGTVAASPMLTHDGKVIVGGFDGFLRAYDELSGEPLWTFGTRDHIYASPGQLPDGTIVQPSADGTIYGLDPADGSKRWAFDTLEAVRSSPAIDADGNVYVGSGQGRLFVLNPDGTLRWSMQLIEEERNDLNASPALGKDAIYIAGESGEIFSVPYDYCLRTEGASDPRCIAGSGEDLPSDGAKLLYTTQLGSPVETAPGVIDANQTLAFSLYVREAGDTVLALLDSDNLVVTAEPASDLRVEVSGDRRFLTAYPTASWTGDPSGQVAVRVSGQYLVNPDRKGLKFSGGTVGGTFEERFTFDLRAPETAAPAMQIPSAPGEPSSVWEIYRLAAPLPTIMPSYNQIGFDSLHFLLGVVEGTPDRFIGWVAGGKLAPDENLTVIDPSTKALFPLEMRYEGGLLTAVNEGGFGVEAMSATLSFNLFRLTARLDGTGTTVETPRLLVSTTCSSIELYGPFLQTLGLCNAQTDVLSVFGAALLRRHEAGTQQAPSGVGDVAFSRQEGKVEATVTGSSVKVEEHSLGLLLVDASTGKPLSLDYGLATSREAAADGTVTKVALKVEEMPETVRVWLMVDTTPAAVGEI